MTQQLVCDECGEPIDQTRPYYSVDGTKVQLDGDMIVVIEPVKQMHYHVPHLPHTVLEPAPPEEVDPDYGVTPDPDPPHPDQTLPPPESLVDPDYGIEVGGESEPEYDVDISSMTIQQALAWAGQDQDKIRWAIGQEEAGQNRRSLIDQLNNRLD